MRITDGTPYWTEVKKMIVEYTKAQGLDFTFQNLEAELENLTAKYGGRKGRLLAALDDDGTALGCIAYRRHNGLRCEMKRFYVRPQARGRKVGLALLHALVDLSARDGYDEMVLDTVDHMSAKRRRDQAEVNKAVRSAVSTYLFKHTKRSPMIIPMVVEL